MKENFPNLTKEIDIKSRKHRVSNQLDPKRAIPRQIIIKMQKIKDKERILKEAREKQLPYFLDYKTHQTIRHTQVLEEENRGKNPLHRPSPFIPPLSQAKLHLDYKMHPHFPPKFGGKSVSYSLKNTVCPLVSASDWLQTCTDSKIERYSSLLYKMVPHNSYSWFPNVYEKYSIQFVVG